MRLHLEIEQSYQGGKLAKWSIFSASIYPVSKILFCAGKCIKCKFYVCNFCSVKLNPMDFVIKTIRKGILKQKVNSISNQHATSGQFFLPSLRWFIILKRHTDKKTNSVLAWISFLQVYPSIIFTKQMRRNIVCISPLCVKDRYAFVTLCIIAEYRNPPVPFCIN